MKDTTRGLLVKEDLRKIRKILSKDRQNRALAYMENTEGKKSLPKAERYQRLEKLGRGTYGTVYRGIDTWTGQEVAIKKIKRDVRRVAMTCRLIRRGSLHTRSKKPRFTDASPTPILSSKPLPPTRPD